jgi:hypothetical protein
LWKKRFSIWIKIRNALLHCYGIGNGRVFGEIVLLVVKMAEGDERRWSYIFVMMKKAKGDYRRKWLEGGVRACDGFGEHMN